jgi:diguanylate cyclase (GGDEF)-like protein
LIPQVCYMENQLTLNLLALSICVQCATAGCALLQLRKVRNFRYAWISLSLAMILMIEARATQFISAFGGEHANWASAALAVSTSVLLFYGIRGLAALFAQMDAQERELQSQANEDFLTGAKTRRAFQAQANQEYSRSRRSGVPLTAVTLDIDHFKAINDTWGHQVGDAALRHFSMLCAHSIRDIDLFGRLGGEEFTILLPDTEEAGACQVAERIRVAVQESGIKLSSQESIHFTVSIGVATLQSSDRSITELLLRADQALYDSKNNGRNRTTVASSYESDHEPSRPTERKLVRVV